MKIAVYAALITLFAICAMAQDEAQLNDSSSTATLAPSAQQDDQNLLDEFDQSVIVDDSAITTDADTLDPRYPHPQPTPMPTPHPNPNPHPPRHPHRVWRCTARDWWNFHYRYTSNTYDSAYWGALQFCQWRSPVKGCRVTHCERIR